MSRGFAAVLPFLLVAVAAAEDTKAAETKPASNKPSTLAPVVKYLDMWQHLHSKDIGAPKIVFLPSDEEAAEAPSWYTSAAMRFKEGRVKKVAFLAVKAGKDAKTAALRFGLSELPSGGAIFACVLDKEGGGHAKRFDSNLDGSAGASERVRALKAFVDGILEGVPEEERLAMPAFPEPTRPRKQAAVSLEEFTHETLSLRCYGVQAKPLCVFEVADAAAGSGCSASVGALAKRHVNDPISFGCVGGKQQIDFLHAFGLAGSSAMPALIAVKAGKRPRYAKLEAPLEAESMHGFIDTILGGGASFSRLSELPELEAPYLLEGDKDEV